MSSQRSSYPDSFKCPLTSVIMTDPVMDPEGNSYERAAITAWLQKNQTSPLTGKPLQLKELIPNRALKDAINQFQKSNLISSSALAVPDDHLLQVDVSMKNGSALVSVQAPNSIPGVTRTRTDVVCVIDISGSMGSESFIKSASGQYEGFGFSTLDLVKHSVSTIINTLEENDRLSLVSFTDDAAVVLDLTVMNEDGRQKAQWALSSFSPQGSTNLWAGLQTGLDVLRSNSSGKNSALLILTDGMPNVVPPRGHQPMLEKYIEQHGLPGVVHTFGFGYSLDSKLLSELAIKGTGAYSFIPDGSLVGTIFVNALSNLLATVATNVKLDIDVPKMNATSLSLVKNHSQGSTNKGFSSMIFGQPKGLHLNLDSMIFGQSKDFVFPVAVNWPKKVPVTLKYESPYSQKPITLAKEFDLNVVQKDNVEIHTLRLKFVNAILAAVRARETGRVAEVQKILETLIEEFNKSNVKDTEQVRDLLKDLEDQAAQALLKEEYYSKWGVHYLPSLVRAHLLQRCNNFKDPGVQHYGGEVFNQLRDKIDEIFINLPPPKPSIKRAGATVVSSMSVFYNPNAPCFDGDCLVAMANGTSKRVKDLKKEDAVLGPDGKSVKVVCVVETPCENNRTYLAEFASGLRITPYHPVRIDGRFHFPRDIEQVREYKCPAVYSFVLESQHIIKINGVECVTWGHDFQDDVVRHPYFGTAAVLADLQYMEGWEQGIVRLSGKSIKRDPKTGMVNGLRNWWMPGSLIGVYFKAIKKVPGLLRYSVCAARAEGVSSMNMMTVWNGEGRAGAEIIAGYAASRKLLQAQGTVNMVGRWAPKILKRCLRIV